MKRSRLILVSFLLLLYIGPPLFALSYASSAIPTEPNMTKDFSVAAGEAWYNESWNYRKSAVLKPATGIAGTDYQVLIPITYDSNMQSDFDDLRFTDNDGNTSLDYWIETYTANTNARVWVKVDEYISENQAATIYMYYGNDAVSTTSSGNDTFQAFFDKDSTSGWTTSNIAVSTSGDFLRFYNPTAGDAGEVQRWDITTSADFQMMARYKTVSVGASDQGVTILGDASASDRFSYAFTPYSGTQTEWQYHDGARKAGGAWTEGTEFIFTVQIDEGDSTNGVDFRRYNTSWSLLDSVLSENFAAGSPTDCDGIYMGDASGAATIDLYVRWLAFRKCVDSEPVVDSWGEEENNFPPPEWEFVGDAEITFSVAIDETGLNILLIFLGLIMIPTSTIYAAKGGLKEASSDKLFYFLIVFVLGWGLFLGGIFG